MPIRSKRGMRVYACDSCGLLQSVPTTPYVSRPPGNLSSDADRSSHRYTKTLTNQSYEPFIRAVPWGPSPRILDVGSNRGVFAQSILSRVPSAELVCIEPDPGMEAEIYDRDEVVLHRRRFEETKLESSSFDFIFCAHTLEHAYSARTMLKEFERLLRPGGTLFLAVPNTLLYDDVIEELFIDPHTFHFEYAILKGFAEAIGFEVRKSSDPADHEIRLLLRKRNTPHTNFISLGTSVFDLEGYSALVKSNRKRLQLACRRLERRASRNGLVVWGAGRILDSLFAAGTLSTNRILGVVDSFLHQITPVVRGLQVVAPDSIPPSWLKARLLVASRDYSEEIRFRATELGFQNIETFLEMWHEDESAA